MKKRRILLAITAIVIALGVVFGWTPAMLYLGSTKNDQAVRVAVDGSKPLTVLADSLKAAGIIKDTDKFLLMAKYKELKPEQLESGMYEIPAGTSWNVLLNSLKSGNFEVEVVVTFNNCKTIGDLCEKVSKCLLINQEELNNYILSEETLRKYDFTLETMPALFLPNSYRMYYDTDKEQFVDRMAEEFKKFWTEERLAKLRKVGLKSPSQAVTLASIVYGEQSTNASEWPIIAGLYLNRLNTGMKLQSDPTFKFCWEDQLEGVQRLTYEHRSKDCPYNTYLYAGLPPGPISMPPVEVVDAVLNRDHNDYLYMCAQPSYDGLHNFTKDYAVHDRNAKEFQSWLANELKNQ